VIEVALGLIIGAGFSNVVTSLVNDIILPPLSLLSSTSRNLESHFVVLRQGDTLDAIYNTIEQAAADGSQLLLRRLVDSVGAIYMAWGVFLQRVFTALSLDNASVSTS